ncbi:MAG: hypothetical protein ACJAVI_006217 [Candidatus Azotimanducaceae bacterium]|jgi:uncharacterized protein (TIGR02647 family)
MHLDTDFLQEVELLTMFNLNTSQEGIKIHHEASPERISAGKRLFAKDLISQLDGGYLTPLGQQAAEHIQALVRLLDTKAAEPTE